MSFTPFRQTKVVINNPLCERKYNWLGGAEDIKHHDYIHNNIRFTGGWAPVAQAFTGVTPFKDLGWADPACPTAAVDRWWHSKSPVSDDYMVSFETKKVVPTKFLQFVANKYKLSIQCTSHHPYITEATHLAVQPQQHN